MTSPERTSAASSLAGRKSRSCTSGSLSLTGSWLRSQSRCETPPCGACQSGRRPADRPWSRHERTDTDVQSGLEGVVAFATEIAEPDREGGALRYRGVDIEDLVGKVPFEQVWGLLVDGTLRAGPAARRAAPADGPLAATRASTSSRALAMLAPEWGFGQLIDIADEPARDDLARASVMALSFVAQSARGTGRPPVPQHEVDKGESIPERFLIRWRGEAEPGPRRRRSTPTGSRPPSTA